MVYVNVMIVYMLLNTVTEKAYVGATDKSLNERWKRHRKDAAHGSQSRLHAAMREWSCEDLWERVVLANCYSVEELSEAEEAWMSIAGTSDPSVGYNDNKVSYARSVLNGKKGGDPVKKGKTNGAPSPLEGLSEAEQKEFFRACGRKGTKPKAELTDEERERYREWGRRGAEKSKRIRASSGPR